MLVHGPSSVEEDVVDWSIWESPVGPMHVPKDPEIDAQGIARWTLGDRQLALWIIDQEELNVFDDAFKDALALGCGCRLTDRSTTWIDGLPGIRYRTRHGDLEHDWSGEIWAISLSANQTVVISSLAPYVAINPGGLSTGRAFVGLIEWNVLDDHR